MTRRKNICGFVLMIFAIFFVFCIKPIQAHAASYKTAKVYSEYYSKKERTANGVTFETDNSGRTLYATKGGKKSKLMKVPSGYTVQATVLTDGKNVIFVSAADNASKCIFYRCTVKGKSRKKIASVYAGWPAIAGYYKGYIYYVDGSATGRLTKLNVSTGKAKVVYKKSDASHISLVQAGKYICYVTYEKTYSYNAATGKNKKIGKGDNSVCGEVSSVVYNASSGYLYYIEGEEKSISEWDNCTEATIIRCKPDGSKKRTLLKNIEMTEVTKFTTKSITYIDPDGKTKTKKF